jgi:transposase InsO family protein
VNPKTRLSWIQLYEQTNDFGLVCRRCGISRPTLRKWWNRYKQGGLDGLQDRSRQRLTSQSPKVTDSWEKIILELRKSRNLGAKRIQAEMIRQHNFKLSTATISKTLSKNKVKPLLRLRTKQKPHRYNRPVPGDRVQIDTTKIANGIYQYTAIDDCTRFRVLGIYSKRTAQNSVHFLEERMIEEFPFPIQRIQTDRGNEFFGLEFQLAMQRNCIKFRPNKPRSPHLNGKVERSQMTDKVEFYPTVNLTDEDLADQLETWQFDYNWHRPHSSLGGKSPLEKVCELLSQTPLSDEVFAKYNPVREPLQVQNYKAEMQARKLKQ